MGRTENTDWNDLRFFLAAARAGSLAGAARALAVEHSTIGRRLTALEEALGVRLLTRGPDGLALTDVGRRALPLAEEIERAVRALGEVVTSATARVRLATPSGFSRVLSPHLAAFQARHPEITVELLSGSRPVDLRNSEADLAIRMGVPQDEDLVARRIRDLAWSLYAAPAYLARRPAPADPRQLGGHDLIGFGAGLETVPGARWIEVHGAGGQVVVRCREVADLLAACVAGLGLAILPCFFAETEPSLVRLTPEVLATVKASIVYRKEVLVAAPVRAVLELVTEVMNRETASTGE